MSDQITKIVFRRGLDETRRTANSTGVIFDIGEPGFATDTKRLYIGDGTAGGTPIGIKNFGVVDTLFGTHLGSNFSPQAYSLLSAADVGDIIYESSSTSIYSLSSRSNFSTSTVPVSTDFYKFDLQTRVNSSQFFYSGLELTIQNQGITPPLLNFSVVDNITITKPTLNSAIQLKQGNATGDGVRDIHFGYIPPNSLYLNYNSIDFYPKAVPVQPKQLIGRSSTSGLTAINYADVFTEAPIYGVNGVGTYKVGSNTFITLSTSNFTVVPNRFTVNTRTDVYGGLNSYGTLSATGITTLDSNLTVKGNAFVVGDITAFYTSDTTLKENITKIESPLEKLNKMSGYRFDWKKDINNHLRGTDLGVLAQEVEQVLPEAVIKRDTGYKAVNYQKIIPLLIEAIKELKLKIDKNDI
ncbi:MAG: tail fiber domain-containing protein [Proteobacteria bacterium]|nr:tail fiber domain-containing protein [Pseudomonadota bacterium]